VFRIDLSRFGIGTARVVFSHEHGPRAAALHLDVSPLTLQKRTSGRNPRPWINGALAVGAAVLVERRRRAGRVRRRAPTA
jgi:hypothetical protein